MSTAMPRTTIQFQRRQLRGLAELSYRRRTSVSALVREATDRLLEDAQGEDAAAASMVLARIGPREECAPVAS